MSNLAAAQWRAVEYSSKVTYSVTKSAENNLYNTVFSNQMIVMMTYTDK
jgi:hypothetical protein